MQGIVLYFIIAISKLLFTSQPAIKDPLSLDPYKLQDATFRNPLDIPLALAANFGEIRRDHFHMGLDIRTNGKENLPVYAAADGYVSKISVSEGGFGNAIYITHYNGYTTVYAHLNRFYDALQSRLKQMQYERETWEIELSFEGNEFPVKQGQFIAYSGNTGASGGPHLHFEIRDTKTGANQNPLQFLNIPDNIPPAVYGVYYYDRNYNAYDAAPKQVPVKKADGVYEGGFVKTGSDKIILGVRAEDKSSNSPFMFGVYSTELKVDGKERSSFQLDNFDYSLSRAVNASVDYSTWRKSDRTIQYLYRLPGNPLNIYKNNDGVIDLSDGAVHDVEIYLSDINENRSTIRFQIQYDSSLSDGGIFTTDRFMLKPNQDNHYEDEDVKIDFSKESIYDTVPLRVQEQEAGGASKAITIGSEFIPVHAPYTVSVKANANGLTYKDRVVMQMQAYRLNTVKKGEWKGDFMKSSFNKFGRVQLVVDLQPPIISAIGFADGSSVYNNGSLRFTVKDDLGVGSVRAELDGKFLLFKKSGNTYSYIIDEHAAPGSHELKITALDVAGNRSEKRFRIERVDREKIVKKKTTKKRKKR